MVTMSVQYHKYWFICYIDPANNKPMIFKTELKTQYETDALARNMYGAKGVKYVVVGTDSLGNEATQHIKAECMKLTGDLNWGHRATHQNAASPGDIVT
jgi:hypothetical protein